MLIVFKDAYFFSNRKEISANDYEKNLPAQPVHAGTRNTYTSVLIYKSYC
jgi:hypothetical protein